MYGHSNHYAPAQHHHTGARFDRNAFPMTAFGADPPPSTMDNLKAFMEKETMGVKNKFLFAGAAALGIGYYGYTKGWF